VSAAPKQVNPTFWMEARVVELPSPGRTVSPPQIAQETVAAPRTRVPSVPRLTALLRFERTIWFAILVFLLMTLSAVSHQSLMRKIEAQDSRARIQELGKEIGQLREELQEARAGLETSDAPEGFRTIPIEPGDVATVTLPAPSR
jgi:hypothetical protein